MKINNNIFNFEKILIGVLVYSIGNFFYANYREICYPITGLSIIVILTGIKGNIYYMPFKGFIRYSYFLLLFLLLISAIRGFFEGQDNHSLNPILSYGILAYSTPLIVLIGTQNIKLKIIIKYSIISAIIAIIFYLINFNKIFGKSMFMLTGEEYQEYLSFIFPLYTLIMNTCLAFLIYFLLNKKQKFLLFTITLLLLYTMIYSGRRGAILMTLITIMCATYLYLFKYKQKGNIKLLKWIFTISSIAILITFFYLKSNTLFSFLNERGLEDSRTQVEVQFYKNFEGKYLDWLFGRGISGTYEDILFDLKNNQRGVIETGYLFIILKSGIISLLLFLVILLNSFIKGFFRSNNIILKAMALYILIHIIYLYPSGIPLFSLEYVFLWCAVAYCQTPYWRNLNDYQILKKAELK